MKATLLVLLFLLAGCAHSIHQYHVSDYHFKGDKKPRQIQAQSEQFVIMGFVYETDYVNTAYNQLLSQCPGEISGLNSRYSTSLGFFSWTHKLVMTAYCHN